MIEELSDIEKTYKARWQGIMVEELLYSMNDFELDELILKIILLKTNKINVNTKNITFEQILMEPLEVSAH